MIINAVNRITFINNVFDDYMNVLYILAFDLVSLVKGLPKSSKQILRSSPSELTLRILNKNVLAKRDTVFNTDWPDKNGRESVFSVWQAENGYQSVNDNQIN